MVNATAQSLLNSGLSDSSDTDDELLSTFLETYPTKLNYHLPSRYRLWVFWSQNDEASPDTSSSDDPEILMIHKKIRSTLSEIFPCGRRLVQIQFWAPIEIGGRRLLATDNQPFAQSGLGSYLKQYRLCCLELMYYIDVNNLEVEKNPNNISGAPARAFLNRVPEFIPDLTVSKGCPLLNAKLECGFTKSFVLPIFSDPSQSCCIGVFECCTGFEEDSLDRFSDLESCVKEQGLYPFDANKHISSKNISSLENVKNDIDKALQLIVDVHRLGLGQVWIAYEEENSSLDGTQKKQMSGFRLTAHHPSIGDDVYESYYHAFRNVPLVNGIELAERTLQNNEAQFCLNISMNGGDECSCFTVCLKNSKTHDLRYVFEFFWDEQSHYIDTLESLIVSLKKYLPSFNLISGAQLGDELHVMDTDDSTGSGNRFFNIFKGKGSSSMPSALHEGNKSVALVKESTNKKWKTARKELPLEKIEQQFGKTMAVAARNLGVSVSTLKRKWKDQGEWPGPNYKKKKVNDSNNNQKEANDEEDSGAIEDMLAVNRNKKVLTIKAEYAGDTIRFDLPISSLTFGAIEKEIREGFGLDVGTYKLKYRDEDDEWILLNSDKHMKYLMESFGGTTVRMLVTDKFL